MTIESKTTYTIAGDQLYRAARVLNSTKSTAGDYYDALKELVGFAEQEEGTFTLPHEPGSVIAGCFTDIEGDIAERTSDGWWMVAGEGELYSDEGIWNMHDGEPHEIKILRRGYDD